MKNKIKPRDNGRCIHYNGVEKGFYCWKCLEMEVNFALEKQIKKHETTISKIQSIIKEMEDTQKEILKCVEDIELGL